MFPEDYLTGRGKLYRLLGVELLFLGIPEQFIGFKNFAIPCSNHHTVAHYNVIAVLKVAAIFSGKHALLLKAVVIKLHFQALIQFNIWGIQHIAVKDRRR